MAKRAGVVSLSVLSELDLKRLRAVQNPAHESRSFLTQLVLNRGRKWLKGADHKSRGCRCAFTLPLSTHKTIDQKGRGYQTIDGKDERIVCIRHDALRLGIREQKIIKRWEKTHWRGRISLKSGSVWQIKEFSALLVPEGEQFWSQNINSLLKSG